MLTGSAGHVFDPLMNQKSIPMILPMISAQCWNAASETPFLS
jgi:hypothetical protein